MQSNPHLQDLKVGAQRAGLEYVQDYWRLPHPNDQWRIWKHPTAWQQRISPETQILFIRELDSRKIKIRSGGDILCWGKAMQGMFTVKEAYYRLTREDRPEDQVDWKKLWEGKWWPKVTMFAWLVCRERILTWDQMQKRGMVGPSWCYLCNNDIENQEHLLNSCLYTQSLWEEVRVLFGQVNRDPQSLRNTILQWGTGHFHSKLVRRIWSLTLGFVIWEVWKERNRCTFKDRSCHVASIWDVVCRSIKETILSEPWREEDWQLNLAEQRILCQLSRDYTMLYPNTDKRTRVTIQSPNRFRFPLDNCIKLSFDGASEGNPGDAGWGGIFRDSDGISRWVYAEWGGEMSNNEAELWGIFHGIRIAARNGYRNLDIEGDSQIVIEMLRKLQRGKAWDHVAKSWRTAAIIQDIEHQMRRIDYITVTHVLRRGNREADYLENWACGGSHCVLDGNWVALQEDMRWHDLAVILRQDNHEARGDDRTA